MGTIISGIQQVGLGVEDVSTAWAWYRKYLGMDVPIFHDSAEATYMGRYTGEKIHSREEVLAINLQGGGAFEIWQFKSRKPTPSKNKVHAGDLGIFAATVKTKNIEQTFRLHQEAGILISPAIQEDPTGIRQYFINDLYGNIIQIVESHEWFARTNHVCGGVSGAMIGVSDIQIARKLYEEVIGYHDVVFEVNGTFADYEGLPGAGNSYKRLKLRHGNPGRGSFGKLLGTSTIELVQVEDRKPIKIYQDRFWGDPGFIHLCFDIRDMDSLKDECAAQGFPFTVDSAEAFDMGEAAGRFSYTEDADGTLIEFVETAKMSIMKKFGLYIDLSKRNPEKPLPSWMLKALRFARVK